LRTRRTRTDNNAIPTDDTTEQVAQEITNSIKVKVRAIESEWFQSLKIASQKIRVSLTYSSCFL